jgi:SAM-dependent methyltransferase
LKQYRLRAFLWGGDDGPQKGVEVSWEVYFEKNKDRTLRPLYSKAISLFDSKPQVAMDLGCGVGTEVADLLQRGFTVHALDQESSAIDLVKAKTVGFADRLLTYVMPFELMRDWPSVDFLYSFHALPFCNRTYFDEVVNRSIKSITPGGLYVASFFGFEDEWVVAGKVVGISSDEVRSKLHGFEILHFEEDKKLGKTVMNGEKMWHTIEIIAQHIDPLR